MEARGEERRIKPTARDLIVALVKRRVPQGSISEAKIGEFCHGCDMHRSNNRCANFFIDDNDQASFAARGSCRYAQVNGRLGRMTKQGFKRSS